MKKLSGRHDLHLSHEAFVRPEKMILSRRVLMLHIFQIILKTVKRSKKDLEP